MKQKFILLIIGSVMAHCAATAQTAVKPLVFGVTCRLSSRILNETRTINIYLPEGYNANDTITYPVIYIPDGGVEEDFFHIAGIVRYNTQPWINRFPKSIVVGIENTNRKRDLTFAVSNLDFLEKIGYKKEDMPYYGGSANYIAFLEQELQPYIAKQYKVNKSRTIIGESLAGLLATEILLKYPGLFDTYIIVSPSLWWGNESLLKAADSLSDIMPGKQIKVFIAAPSKRENESMYKEAKMLYKAVRKHQNITAFFDYLPDELHSTVIHRAVYDGFKQLYPKTAFSE